MKQTLTLVLLFSTAWVFGQGQSGGRQERELKLPDGQKLHYTVQLPLGFDPAKPYPVLLALPPGPQNGAMVEAGFRLYWGERARKVGWVVVSPRAPKGELFFQGAEALIPPLLKKLRSELWLEGNRFHLAGVSNGGLSAFRVATEQPFQFRSLTALPGFPPTREDWRRLKLLKGLQVSLYAGGADARWAAASRRAAERLQVLGIPVSLTIFPGEGHTPRSLEGGVIMKRLQALRPKPAPPGDPAQEVAHMLDALHVAAARGDEEHYFKLFAPEAVFLGTDPGERWPLAAFRRFAMPYFKRPSAWIYVPVTRHVVLAPGGQVAWFDEVLGNAHYGLCRSTGADRKQGGRWKLSQYSLSVPIPNVLLDDVVKQIRALVLEAAKTPVTRIFLVRHAEKEEGPGQGDPPLSPKGQKRALALAQALSSVPLRAIFTTPYKRTQATVAPIARALELTPRILPAEDIQGLVQALSKEAPGGAILVCGHLDTLPAIISALGVKSPVTLGQGAYSHLFVVTLEPGRPARLLDLHYGTPSGS